MAVTKVQLYRYALPFTEPLPVGTKSLAERRGLLLRLDGEERAVGWGEAAPLPEFSIERIEEAAEALRQVARTLFGREVEGLGRRHPSILTDDVPPSVLFALDSAIAELRMRDRGVSMIRLLGGGTSRVFINALIGADQNDLEPAAQRIRGEGYRAVKLKVGRTSVEQDIRRVRTVGRALGEEVSLRLDANRAWTEAEARTFAGQIDDVSVSYIEEPLANPDGIPRFIEDTELPVGLDETTRECVPEDLENWGNVAAVVLKPTLLGGIPQVQEWVRAARAVGATPVFSATYESGVGIRMLIALAAVYSNAPAGFSTYERLGTDVLTPRLSLPRSEVEVDQAYDSIVEASRLEEIATYE